MQGIKNIIKLKKRTNNFIKLFKLLVHFKVQFTRDYTG